MPTMNLENIADISGNGRGLTLGGRIVPAFESDPFAIGQSAIVMSADVQLAASGALYSLPSGDYTLEFRFKRNTAKNGLVQVVAGRWGVIHPSAEYQYLVYWSADNRLNFLQTTTPTGAPVVVSTGVITDGNPHAYRVTRTSGALAIYVDGARVGGPSAVGSPAVVSNDLPFLVGSYTDRVDASPTVGPLWGVLGDFRLSSTSRSSGSSYTVDTAPLSADTDTLALLPMSSIRGTYLSEAVFAGTVLSRTGYPQASGGWANPDGPLPKIGGGWFFSVSAYSSSTSKWTCWAVSAPTVAELFAGSGTMGAQAIQTPQTSENGLAANGTVIAWGGTYYHYYQEEGAGGPNIRYSTGSDLGAPFSPQPGNILFPGGYFDPWVRPSKDGTHLVMYMMRNSDFSFRDLYRSTSTDGQTWTTPVQVLDDARTPQYEQYTGEFAVIEDFDGGYLGWADGAISNGQPRNAMRWVKRGTGAWVPLGLHFTATGVDANSADYIAAYDTSPWYDEAQKKIHILATHSINTEAAQPTNSDIAVWSSSVIEAAPAIDSVIASLITVDGARITLGLTR